ncbi:MAG: hypothetical protein IT177_16460 [Acidobacteria bacterium]|nr:hypothetical protein [Acidobacteriota bacterium]
MTVRPHVRARRTRLLSRAFFGRLFENDLFSSSVSASSSVTWMLAALATPGVMFSGSQMFNYAHVRTFAPEAQDRIFFASQAFHVNFAMAIAGLVTMMVWTSLTPDRLDALVLGPLPLRAGEQARARLAALLRFFTMFATAVAVPTAVAFTSLTLGPREAGLVLPRIAGHVAGTMLGAGFVFFLLLDLQLVLAAVLGPRAVRAATWPLQGAALAAMVSALSYTPSLAEVLQATGPSGQAWVMWNPATWFVGIYRWIAGDHRDVFTQLAARATLGSTVAVTVGLVVYPLAYQRCLVNAVAGQGRREAWYSRTSTRVWLANLAPLLRTPLERGLAAFIVATLSRSHAHRFLVGSYAGMALLCALPIAGRLFGPADSAAALYAWFSVPLGLLCWTAAGLRVAMMLPVEPAANWIFQLTEPVDKRRVLSTAVTVIASATALPLALAFGAAAAVAGGAALGLSVFAVVLATGLALIELLTLTLRAVPCTCTYRPGQLRLRVLWPVYLLVWLLLAYQLPTVAVGALGHLDRSLWLVGTLLAAWTAIRAWRLSRARRLRGFVYDEAEPSATTTINLGAAGVS